MRIGRPPAMTPEQVRHARALLAQPDNTVASIAKLLVASRTTVYKYVRRHREFNLSNWLCGGSRWSARAAAGALR
ncbi:helix-turn-helix domain-containing protein [Streptomyces sp. NPDC001276]|uniref:helix-turn-helix domain-containing protein n=1 Tax=Streptomyces sp. NPDC001276 TaxID=3364555 RepID=UPI00369552B0